MIYRTLKFATSLVLATLRRWQVQGRENYPSSGGFLVVANHISYWDPVAVICSLRPKVYFLAKEELFRIPVFRNIISLGAFPVRRGIADRQAIRTALNLLKEGQVVGIFPEGTRSYSGELLKPHQGAAMIALKAGVPVVPVAVSGTKGFWRKISVHIGKPIIFAEQTEKKISKLNLEKATELIMYEIAALMRN